ncbi:MAG: tetratricopeptide repeat protein [Deltaproteobacteria bacterium]|nr:tetratricopeptide repeat protein [Deltaproteobacteria bacterium]
MTCTFCRAPSVVTPLEGLSVCATCSRRIGRLAAAGTKEIWAVDAVSRSSPPPPSSPSPSSSSPDQPSFTKMLRMFQQQVSQRISADDNESHYHLAHAYRAMGLHEDAVRAAGRALDVDPPSVPLVESLVMLLTPPLMKDGGMAVLRMRMMVE